MDKHLDLKTQVIRDGRENGISYTLFRNILGKEMGLNSTDFSGLDLIFYRGVSTPSELAVFTGLSSGSTTAMIDRLEKAKLIKREANPDDRRGTLLVINKVGAKKFGPLFASARAAQDTLLDNFTDTELRIISRYFKASTEMLDEQRKQIV